MIAKDIKYGDTVICKKNFHDIFEIDKFYIVCEVFGDSIMIHDKGGIWQYNFYTVEQSEEDEQYSHYFDDYFYSYDKIRKLKIKTIINE